MTSALAEKWWPFNFFSVQGTGCSPTGPDPENRVYDQDIGNPRRPVSSGLQVPGEPVHCSARTRPHWWPSWGIFPSKCPSVTPAKTSVVLCTEYFILFCSILFWITSVMLIAGRNGWVHFPVEQTGRPDHLSFCFMFKTHMFCIKYIFDMYCGLCVWYNFIETLIWRSFHFRKTFLLMRTS